MKNTAKALTPKAKYDNSRANLLLMIIFTAVNVIFAVTGLDYMMLFTATIPYWFATLGTIEELSMLLLPGIVLAFLGIAVYFVCWLLSKKHYAWMIVALVLFSMDTLAMVAIYVLVGDFSGIIDMLIHAWVMFYLITGVINGYKLKKQPDEEIQSTLNGDSEAWTVINGEKIDKE